MKLSKLYLISLIFLPFRRPFLCLFFQTHLSLSFPIPICLPPMHAALSLATQIRNGATLLRRNLATPPLKLLSLPAAGDTLHAVQMSSSPGLLAGDTIDTEIELSDATSLALYTQAFTRVLSMHEGGEAALNTRIRLHPGSRLLFLPHPLVLHQGSTKGCGKPLKSRWPITRSCSTAKFWPPAVYATAKHLPSATCLRA